MGKKSVFDWNSSFVGLQPAEVFHGSEKVKNEVTDTYFMVEGYRIQPFILTHMNIFMMAIKHIH